MKAVALLFAAMVWASVEGWGQGQFYFNNRVPWDGDPRFVLSTDPPGSSSVGPGYRVELFGGRAGAPVEQLQPLSPASTTMRTNNAPLTYGYVVPITAAVPDVPVGGYSTILVRVFDSPSWETAAFRFERLYPNVWLGGDPGPAPNFPFGIAPLVLEPVPEPSTIILAVLGLGAVLFTLWRSRSVAMLSVVVVAASVSAHGQGQFYFNNRIGTEVNARILLGVEPFGTSLIGSPDWSVQLIGGPLGWSVAMLGPLDPPSTGFRGPPASVGAGFVEPVTVTVPGVPTGGKADVLLRVIGPQGVAQEFGPFTVSLGGDVLLPPNLQLGTSPFILNSPEPTPLALLALGIVLVLMRPRIRHSK